MKIRIIAIYLFTFLMVFDLYSQNLNREYYVLKVLNFSDEAQQTSADNFIKNAYMSALKRQKIKNIGVFKNRASEKFPDPKTFLLYAVSDLNQIHEIDLALAEDRTFIEAGGVFLSAPHEKPAFERLETHIMYAFENMPKMRIPEFETEKKDRVYELRSYESATLDLFYRKVDMFNAGGEITLFENLGFNAVFYSEVIAGPKMPNLIYMTTHANMESREKNWDAFRVHPDWLAMKALPQYQNTVSSIDIYLMYPTDYSDY